MNGPIMSIKALSLEKRKIIDTLLAEYGITIEELFHCYELNRKYQYKSFASRYLSIEEVRQFCPVSRFTLRRWMKKKLIKAIKLSSARGGKVLIDANSLFAYLESCGDGNSDSVKC